MALVDELAWPPELSNNVAELRRLVGKYRFKLATVIVEALIEQLRS